MKTKTFDTYSNIFNMYTPLPEQISEWLESQPNIKVTDMAITKEEASIYYEDK